MYNNKTVELEETIIKLINDSGLHISTVSLILSKVNGLVQNTLNQELEREKQQSQDITQNDLVEIVDND